MEFDIRAVARNIRKADTEELLDRVTIYRDEMEPAAVDLIENELARRGLRPADLAEHESQRRQSALTRDDGTPVRCTYCDRPAVTRVRGWHRIGIDRGVWAAGSIPGNVTSHVGRRLLGWIPLFPRTFYYCQVHRPAEAGRAAEAETSSESE